MVALSCCKHLYFFFSSTKLKKKWFNNLTMVSFWIYCIQKDGSNYSRGTDSTPHSNFAVKQQHLIYGPVFICWPVSSYFGHSYDHYIINLICNICWQQTDCIAHTASQNCLHNYTATALNPWTRFQTYSNTILVTTTSWAVLKKICCKRSPL